ncbi:hypothetical protein B0H13DRAFT_1874476 [Mycena leptocephala]|nr:hypothetical protein B0H13DRAFT_1874476 [Mycena leptocephala]
MRPKSLPPHHQFRLGALSEDLAKLPEHMSTYNVDHHTRRHINRDTFCYNSKLGTEVIAAATVRHYLDYHITLCADDTIPSLAPVGYDKFADTMNELDSSGFGWAQLDENGAILWNNNHEFANPKDFCVLDRDLDSCTYLCAGVQ